MADALRPTTVGRRTSNLQLAHADSRIMDAISSRAASELDEGMEKRVYDLLAARLPDGTVIPVAQRPPVLRYHTRLWKLSPQDHGPSSLQAA